MANDYNHPNRSRSLQRAKRRKTNIVLNSLIVIVILLIIIVASTIFLSGGKNDKKSSAPATHKQEQKSNKTNQTNNESNNQNNDSTTENSDSSGNTNDNNQSDNTTANDNSEGNLDNSKVVANESNDANVKKTYVNPNWSPVGTSQSSGHEYSSDENSVDWQEKEKALAYATGLSPDNMTIWYLGRNSNSSESVVGTITSKNNKKVYRVYLDWVDGQGWKPTKVEELKANDRH